MDGDEQDREDAKEAERVTVEEARRRAKAKEGLGEPTASAEANEPTTAAADRLRLPQG